MNANGSVNSQQKLRQIEISHVSAILEDPLNLSFHLDEVEVSNIARFISGLNDAIPYSLLIFHPDHMMIDMPVTPKKQVFRCFGEAKKHLKHVNIGNMHLLEV